MTFFPGSAMPASAAGLTHGDTRLETRALGQYGMQVFNARTYGQMVADGSDETTKFNSLETDAAAAGGIAYFPPGTYGLNNAALKSNVTHVGVRGKSIWQMRPGAQYLASCDSGSASAFVDNMTFESLTMRGLVDVETTFDEHRHALNVSGVRKFTIQFCDLIGWHGDALYFGSSNSTGVERHNQQVQVLYNLFDGLTKNNRNPISFIDIDGALVYGNRAYRFSRSDMPGFVDVEPNPENAAFAVCRNVDVSHNQTFDHNQNVFQLKLPFGMTSVPTGFIVSHNIDDAGASNTNTRLALLAQGDEGRSLIAETSPRHDVKITDNIVRNSGFPVEIDGGINGVGIRRNTFEDMWGGSIFGYWANGVWNTAVEQNDFIRCGFGEGVTHRIENARRTKFRHNNYINCTGTLVQFSAGHDATTTSDFTDWIDQEISGTLTTAISGLSASHTLTAANNKRRAYRENGLSFNTSHFNSTV